MESDRTPPKAIRSAKIICCDTSVVPRHVCLNFPCDMWLFNRYLNRHRLVCLVTHCPFLMEKGQYGAGKGQYRAVKGAVKSGKGQVKGSKGAVKGSKSQ